MIYFAKLELVGILKVIRLRNDFQPYRWTSWASRISEKMKKAGKGCEGRIKAAELKVSKFDNFLMSIGLLGVLYSLI